jgi:serine/threonine protein kinase
LYYKSDVERDRGCLDDDSVVRFLSGRLGAAERAFVEQHVDGCQACGLLVMPSGPRTERASSSTRVLGAHAFAAGELIAGRYRVERLIGHGGMGEVYSVLDEQLGEHVALKTVRATAADDARAIARLKSEVQLARRVTHPNVCRIYDLGIHAGRGGDLAFLTMELLRGRTLADEIRARGAFPKDVALATARHLVAGLASAHQAGVIHKDLKSDNVMLVDPGGSGGSSGFPRAVITDFGLAATEARALAHTQTKLEFSGTPGYIAPERLGGALATSASDVYSLGVVLFDMLDGAVPSRPAAAEVDGKASVVLDLRDVARRCCDERPEARPTIADLAALLASPARPRSARWRRDVALVGGALLLMAGIALSVRSRPKALATPVAASPASLPEPRPPLPEPPVIAPPPTRVVAPAAPRGHSARRATALAAVEKRPAVDAAAASVAPNAAPVPVREDEPIRSLSPPGGRKKPIPPTPTPEDDAPIDPFVRRR